MDLYVANRNQPNRLYRNNGDGTFTDVAPLARVDDPGSGEGVAWGDYDNDGDLDLNLANYGDGVNRLYRNGGDGTFTDVARAAGVAPQSRSGEPPAAYVGASWADFDNDGLLDLYVVRVNGANLLYRNNGDGTFTDVALEVGVASGEGGGSGRAAAWADYDNDGDLDIFVANFMPGPNWLFENRGAGLNWLVVKATGVSTSRDAIGTRITVDATIAGKHVSQIREIASASSRHAQDSLSAEFGLGNATTARVMVRFPSGSEISLPDVNANRSVTVLESTAHPLIQDSLPESRPLLNLQRGAARTELGGG
jgi:hypothetical protein